MINQYRRTQAGKQEGAITSGACQALKIRPQRRKERVGLPGKEHLFIQRQGCRAAVYTVKESLL